MGPVPVGISQWRKDRRYFIRSAERLHAPPGNQFVRVADLPITSPPGANNRPLRRTVFWGAGNSVFERLRSLPRDFRCLSVSSRFVFCCSRLLGQAEGAAPATKPNVIFVLADDLGYTDVACYGSKYYETPNIDRLAQQGIRLTSHHHCQNCQPTRAALMTGQYGPRTGIYTVGGIDRFDWQTRNLRPVDNVTQLPLDRVTIAQSMKKAGYATGMFGKWHLGEQGEHHPGQRGFDEAIVSMGRHFDFKTNPKTDYPKGEYLADFLTDRAVDSSSVIMRNRSFFICLISACILPTKPSRS